MSYYNAGNAVKIQSFDVSSLYPKDGQFLKFIDATKEWTPSSFNISASSDLEVSGLTLWENPLVGQVGYIIGNNRYYVAAAPNC